jgi:hypothetical protein
MTLIDYRVVRIHKGIGAKNPPFHPLAIGGPNPAQPEIGTDFTVNIAPIPKFTPDWIVDGQPKKPKSYYLGTATFRLSLGVHSIEADAVGYTRSNLIWVVVVPPPPPPPEPVPAGGGVPPGGGGVPPGGGAIPLPPGGAG